MRKLRHIPAHRPINRQLPERVSKMIIPPNDMRHPHIVIIDLNGEHIGRRAVSAQQDEIVYFARLERYLALHMIVHRHLVFIRRAEADRVWRIR